MAKDHIKMHHEFRIFIFKRMVTMRRGNQNLLHTMIDEGLDILPGHVSEDVFASRLADAFATAVFLVAQNAELDARFVQDVGRGHGHFFHSGIIAEIAAGKVEDFHLLGKRFQGTDPWPTHRACRDFRSRGYLRK